MDQYKVAYDEAIAQLTGEGSPFEIGTYSRDGVDYKVYKQAPATLRDVWEGGYQHGDKEFLIYEGERWSYNDMLQQAASFGHQLVNELGVQKGDRVAIAMRNYPEWMTAYIAITSIGAVAVTLNSWGKAKDLEYGLTDAGAKVMFCDQARLDFVGDRLGELGLRAVVARPEADQLPAGAVSVDDFIRGAEQASMPDVAIDSDDFAMMMYTSGTTGKPKGAISTHRALGQAIVNFDVGAYSMAMINPKETEAMMSSGFEPTQMLCVPLFHVSGCHAVFVAAWRGGRRIVMMYKWDVEKALKLIEQERVTVLSSAPSMLLQLLESPDFDKYDISSLISLGGGGSATPAKVSRLIKEKFEVSYPGTGWGLTETNSLGTSFTGGPFKDNPKSAGFLHPIVEIEARNEDGSPCATGEAGELWVKSPSLIHEYWHRPDANEKDFKDGWFNSGDIGYFDENEYLYLSDRAKDMIIKGGENIYPAEIESAVLDHPSIEEVAAFGVADEAVGERVAVAVVAKGGQSLAEDDVKAFAKEQLANFKVPEFVWLIDRPLPRNATGKVLKNELREEYAKVQKATA